MENAHSAFSLLSCIRKKLPATEPANRQIRLYFWFTGQLLFTDEMCYYKESVKF